MSVETEENLLHPVEIAVQFLTDKLILKTGEAGIDLEVLEQHQQNLEAIQKFLQPEEAE